MSRVNKYAEWLIANEDKKGTEEFEIVANAYKKLRGVPVSAAPAGPEPDFLDQIEEFGKGIPRGALGLLESAALGGAAVLDEESELKAREAIQGLGRSAQSYFAPDVGSEDTVGGKFGEAVGSFVGLGATSLIPGVGIPAAGALAIGAGAGEASERARAAGATEGERGTATALGAVVGLSELIPIKVLGNLYDAIGKGGIRDVINRIKRAAIAAGAEGAQEAAAGVAQNLIQRGVYDPQQGVFTDTGEAFGYGAGVGGLVQGLLDLALPKSRGRGAVDPTETLLLEYKPESYPEPYMVSSQGEVFTPEQLRTAAIDAEETFGDMPSDEVIEQRQGADRTSAQLINLEQARAAQAVQAQNLIGYETRDFVTDAEGNTVPVKQVQDNYIIDEVDATKAQIEAELAAQQAEENRRQRAEAQIVSIDQPAPEVIQQRQTADQAQALAAAQQELKGRPQTDLFPKQLVAAEAQAAKRPAPPPPAEPTQKISQKFLKDIGIAPTDTRSRKTKPIYQRLMAKKEVPLSELNAELKAYVDNPDVTDTVTKNKIKEFLGQPETRQLDLAFEKTEVPTVRPEAAPTRAKAGPAAAPTEAPPKAPQAPQVPQAPKLSAKDSDELLQSLKGKSISEQLSILERRGAPAEFTPTTVTEGDVTQGATVSETTLMQESDARRSAARDAAAATEAERRGRNITPAQRIRMIRQMQKGIEPSLADVDPNLRRQADIATEKELELRDQSEEKRVAEAARKQREANKKRTEAAKDTKTEVPKLSSVAQKRPKPKGSKLKSLPEDVVKEANKRIDQGEPGSVNEIISQVKKDLGLPRFQEGVDTPLPASVLKELRQGNLKEALELLSKTDANPTIKRLAKQFSTMVGTTKVAVVPAKPETLTNKIPYYALKDKKTAIAYRQYLDAKGRRHNTIVPGIYVTKSDAKDRKHFNDLILLNEEVSEGLAVSTLMHEMAHAVTANILLNPSHPVTKQLTKLFNLVEPELSSVNGTDNVAEFAAEAYGSEEFRQQLARIQIQVKDNQYVKSDTTRGGKFVSALQAFYNTISNFLKKLIGRAPVELSNTDVFTEVDTLLQKIIAPAADTYGSGDLLQNSTDIEVRDLMRKIGNVQKDFKEPTKKFREDFVNQADKFLKSGVSGKTRRAFLGFLPSQALADVAGSYNKRLGELGLQLHRMMEKQRGDLNTRDNAADGTMKMVDAWVKNNQDVVPLLDEVITESTLEGVDPSKPRSTYEKNKEKLAIWKGLQSRWNKLEASGGQDVYKGMRDSYAKLYQELLAVVNKRIDDLSIDKESKEKLRKSVFDKITERGRIDPYFPLMRSGDYKLSFQAYNEATDSTEPVFLMFETPRERRKYIENVLENDNRVERDSTGELVYNEYDGNDSPTYKKTTSVGFVNEVLEIMETAKVDAAVRNDILNSFIETLPETSFAKNFQKREGVAGFNQNHTQVMRSKIYDIGRQITRLEYTNRITKLREQILGTDPDMPNSEKAAMQRMREKEGTLKDLQNELIERADFAMRPPKDGIAQAANRAAFIWTIGFNTSSALVNLSQVPLFVLPMLGGKHGFRAAGKAITDAAGLVSGTLMSKSTRRRRIRGIVPFGKQDTVDAFAMPSIDNLFEMDEAGNYTVRKDIEGYAERRKELEEILPLVQLAAERGQLNRSLFADSLGLDSSGRDKNIIDRISSWSAFMFHQVEQYNRQVAMLAAYKLELARLNDPKRATAEEQKLSSAKKKELAAQNALYEAQQLNGGSVLETAPRWAQKGIGRVALMYKTYGIQMYYTMLRAAKTMLNRENDPEIRKAAFRQLVAVHGTALFFAGVQGLPLFGAFTLIANLFLDDDEDDAETIVRKHIGEGWYKGGLTALLDVDVSQRVALTNLLFQVNRYNRDASPEETIGYYLGGPAWSVGKSFIRGTGELINGDMQRGIESMVPGAVRNGLKAIRYTEEGALTRRKDPVLDDITTGQLFSQVIGFAPADYARRQEENQGLKRIENTIRNNRSSLLRKYYIAMRMQDYEEAREIKNEILAFNKRIGSRFPKAVITADSVARSMRSHMKTSATAHNGIALSPMFRTALQEHLEDSEPIVLSD
jgi:hypothetical protein